MSDLELAILTSLYVSGNRDAEGLVEDFRRALADLSAEGFLEPFVGGGATLTAKGVQAVVDHNPRDMFGKRE